MKIETFEHEDHQKKIIAEFEAGFMEQYMRRGARKLASKTKIPGFRPGKAPYEVIRRTHGDAAIQEEAINIMLDEVYPQILSESGIKAYGPGKLEEILSLDPPKFSFIISLAPEVELGDYKAIRLEHTPPVIGEERVDEVVERLRRRTGTAVPVERAAEKGDLVAIRLSGHLVDPKEGEEAVLVEENSFEMVAGTPEDHTD
nr:trigger factor [Anaerolinea sp.]